MGAFFQKESENMLARSLRAFARPVQTSRYMATSVWSSFDSQLAAADKARNDAVSGLFDKHKQRFSSGEAVINEQILTDVLGFKDFSPLTDYLSNAKAGTVNRVHYEALLDMYARLGEPEPIITLMEMMNGNDILTDEQAYTYLFRSYWKNGCAEHLHGVLIEMRSINLMPTTEMCQMVIASYKGNTEAAERIKLLEEEVKISQMYADLVSQSNNADISLEARDEYVQAITEDDPEPYTESHERQLRREVSILNSFVGQQERQMRE